MNLENIINENMLRFGTKNLSESDLKRIEEQQQEKTLLQKAAAAEYSNEYRSGKLKNSFDWNWNNSDTLTIIPRVTFYGQKQEGKWPFNSVSVTYNTQTKKFDKPYVEQDEIAKSAKERLKVTTPKNLARDMKVWVAKQIVKKNEGETLNINEQEKEAEKVNHYAKGGKYDLVNARAKVKQYTESLNKKLKAMNPENHITQTEAVLSGDRIDAKVRFRRFTDEPMKFKGGDKDGLANFDMKFTSDRNAARPRAGSTTIYREVFATNGEAAGNDSTYKSDSLKKKTNYLYDVYYLLVYLSIVAGHKAKTIKV